MVRTLASHDIILSIIQTLEMVQIFCSDINLHPFFIWADDVVVYGGSTSHRVLPPMVGATSSNNSEVANGFETRNRLNPENRVLDYDERAVYQEALQVSLIIYVYMLLASCPANTVVC